MLNPINGRLIVRLDKRVKNTIQVGVKELILDPSFRIYWNTVRVAEVVAADKAVDVIPGDKVYVHHFVQNPEHVLPFEGNHSWLEQNQAFCRVRDGEIKALMNFVFVEPILYESALPLMQTDSGIFLNRKTKTDYVERIGVARILSDTAQQAGLKNGDLILFGKDCEYDIEVEDKLYFRMELRDVICTLDPDTNLTKIS